jgi:hypothetical protein
MQQSVQHTSQANALVDGVAMIRFILSFTVIFPCDDVSLSCAVSSLLTTLSILFSFAHIWLSSRDYTTRREKTNSARHHDRINLSSATVVATTSFVKTFVEGDRFAVRHRTLLLVVAHRRKEWHTSCGHSMENAWWLEHHDGFRFWRSTS